MSTVEETLPDLALVEALRAGDEAVFAFVVAKYHGSLLHVAQQYVSSRAIAEEVVQETWLGVIKGLDRFEGRSSFKTWIFRILTNIAQTLGARESRSIPFSGLSDLDENGPWSVDADRFQASSHRWGGHWASPPSALADYPEAKLESQETIAALHRAIQRLPGSQQRVIWLRDVEGWSAEEVCSELSVTEANQRVLLHRARSRVRAALETELNLECR